MRSCWRDGKPFRSKRQIQGLLEIEFGVVAQSRVPEEAFARLLARATAKGCSKGLIEGIVVGFVNRWYIERGGLVPHVLAMMPNNSFKPMPLRG